MAKREVFGRLNPVKFGVACGIVSAFVVIITALAGVYEIMGGFPVWNAIIFDVYGMIGFRVSWLGALFGGMAAFLDGFVLGALFSWLYNKML